MDRNFLKFSRYFWLGQDTDDKITYFLDIILCIYNENLRLYFLKSMADPEGVQWHSCTFLFGLYHATGDSGVFFYALKDHENPFSLSPHSLACCSCFPHCPKDGGKHQSCSCPPQLGCMQAGLSWGWGTWQ